MKKSTLITIAVIIVLAIGGILLKNTVFAKEEPKQDQPMDFDTTFRNHWAKAWEFKLKEIKHTDKARDFEAQAQFEKEEAEKARIAKENLLFWTWTSLGKIQ